MAWSDHNIFKEKNDWCPVNLLLETINFSLGKADTHLKPQFEDTFSLILTQVSKSWIISLRNLWIIIFNI